MMATFLTALLVAFLTFFSLIAHADAGLSIEITPTSISAGGTLLVTAQGGTTENSNTLTLTLSGSTILMTQTTDNSIFTVTVPSNYFATGTVTIENGGETVSTSYTQYAPVPTSPTNGASLFPNQTITVSVTGIFSTYSYSALFSNGLSLFTTALPYSVTTFPLRVAPNLVGPQTLTLIQGVNSNSVIYYVVSPSAMWNGGHHPFKLGRFNRAHGRFPALEQLQF